MASDLIGRDDEVERICAFLDASAPDGPRALVLEGQAGIGKSTIWLRGLESARDRGLRVLSARPAEAERALTFAGLADLLEDIVDEVRPALPPPRRRALEVALFLADATQDPLDPRALGVAVRSAFELLAREQPLVVAVDDVQWLDGASADALAFALRRTSVPLQILLTRRLTQRVEPTPLVSSLPDTSVEHMHIGPLSAGALQAVVRQRLDRIFPRPTVLRIHATSAGNPFYALEIARALPPELDPTQPLPVPTTLDALVRARIDALPESSRRGLVLLSAMGEADTDTLRKARVEAALEPAVSHGIVERVAKRLRFTHPLLASSVYLDADEATRRSCHADLAEVARDPLERARHLALAADGPDGEIATSLDEAAIVAGARGAPNVAAELGELARSLTPDDDREGRHRRGIVVATVYLRAGDVSRARVLADETLAEATDDRARAEALVLMSAVESASGDRERAVALRTEALAIGHRHPALCSAVHQWLASNLLDGTDVIASETHARASLELAERLDDDYLRAGALAVLAYLRFLAGESEAVALAQEAHALATSRRARTDPVQPRTEIAHVLAWTYDRLDLVASFVSLDVLISTRRFEMARALLDDLDRELAGRDEQLEAKTLWLRSMLEVDAGRWSLAQDLAKREREIAAVYEMNHWPGPFQVLAELAIHGGELDHARQLVCQGRELVAGRRNFLPPLEATLGVADCAGGDPGAAITHFAAAEAAAEEERIREPTQLWWRADFAEALLALGQVDEALELLDAWEPDARRLGRHCTLAHITRCRGLVAAARGDTDLALSTLERAVDQAEAAADPFGRARALLALGVAKRRARQKRRAREAIEAAVASFEQLGEVPWTTRARAELGRIGGRSRTDGLTPAERGVAALVAEGRTNREVAAALVLSERTVASHLTHIYAKLAVRSRTELARVYEPTP